MILVAVLLCLVGSSLEWVDPDWSSKSEYGVYPPLPGSVLLKSYPRNRPVLLSGQRHDSLDDSWLFSKSDSTNGPKTDYTTVKAPDTTTPPPTTPSPTTAAPSSTTPITLPTTTPQPDQNCSSPFTCSDCYTAQICRPKDGKLVPAVQIPCPKTAPFCDFTSGTCTISPDYSRCGAPDNFMCLDNGYFPDPLNCSVYHVCNEYTAQEFFCLEGNVYNPDEEKCESPNKYTCTAVDCSKLRNTNTGIKQIIGDTHYYSYCSDNAPLVVDRCPQSYKLNTTSQVCEPICQRDGLMQDLANCNNYYKCNTFYVNETTPFMVRVNVPCPSEEAFDQSQFQCVPKSTTNCKN